MEIVEKRLKADQKKTKQKQNKTFRLNVCSLLFILYILDLSTNVVSLHVTILTGLKSGF